MTKNDLEILDNLLKRTENLPEILHLRAAKIGYKLTEEDRAILLDTYEELDDILKEVAAFINIKFPGCKRHIIAWEEVNFDTKVGGLKVVTNNQKHIRHAWRQGLFDLKSLIKTLKNEVSLLIDIKSQENDVINNTNKKGQGITNDININRLNKRSLLEMIYWTATITIALISLYNILN
ncbi:hypothetical protein ACOMSG_04765 [Macellibacteroides fermentans]|uniref:hypothetical protein n=1 Tax=Macellibacteroides fermentans TaxID=879969 RepID=UPI003B93DF5C